ncbi:MAG TPA: BON domain-containing protein [Armatimonadota bacterium]|nr:BON domain-containing protein [Armatimonadota bacterium]
MRSVALFVPLTFILAGCMDTDQNGQPDAVAPEVRRAAGRSLEAAARHARDAAKDAQLASSIRSDLGKDPSVRLYRISANVDAGVATLTGEVNTARERARAEQIARKQKGVTSVRNRIQARE